MDIFDKRRLKFLVSEATKNINELNFFVTKYNDLATNEEEDVKSGNYKYTAERIENFINDFEKSKKVLSAGISVGDL